MLNLAFPQSLTLILVIAKLWGKTDASWFIVFLPYIIWFIFFALDKTIKDNIEKVKKENDRPWTIHKDGE